MLDNGTSRSASGIPIAGYPASSTTSSITVGWRIDREPGTFMRNRSRLAALSLWVGGLSALLVHGLVLTALNEADGSIFALTGNDYARWSIFPTLLVLYGLAALHTHQSAEYGRLGSIGFATTVTGYSLTVVGELWSEVLFPRDHPFWFIGPNLSALGLLVVIAGWVVWGAASYTAKSLPSWAAPVPFVIAFVWVAARFYLSDFLYDVFSIRDGILIQAVNAVGLGLLGLVLWRGEDLRSMPTSTDAVLNRT